MGRARRLTRRGGPATSARRCVALIVALHVASRDRTRHSPRFCKLRGLITPGKGPDSSPTPDGDARRGVLARRSTAHTAFASVYGLACARHKPCLNGADVHQCWLRGLLLEAKKKDRRTGTVPAPSARPTAV